MSDNKRHHRFNPGAAVLHIDRVNDCAPWVLLERGLHDISFGRVDDKRQFDLQCQLLDELTHHFALVGPLGQRDADVKCVRSFVHLLPGDR